MFVGLFASSDFEKTLTTQAALCGCFLCELPHVSFLFVLFDLCMNSNKTLAMCPRPAGFVTLSWFPELNASYVIFSAFRLQFLQTRMAATDLQ